MPPYTVQTAPGQLLLAEYRRLKLLEWLHVEGRKMGWLAKQVGLSSSWLTQILHRKVLMSDKLAAQLQAQFGIELYAPVYPVIVLQDLQDYIATRTDDSTMKLWKLRSKQRYVPAVAQIVAS